MDRPTVDLQHVGRAEGVRDLTLTPPHRMASYFDLRPFGWRLVRIEGPRGRMAIPGGLVLDLDTGDVFRDARIGVLTWPTLLAA